MALSLAERERRAKAAQSPKGKSPQKSPMADEGGSLFDKYAGMAGAKHSTDEEEVAELMEMLGQSPGSQRMSARELSGRTEYFLEAGWDSSPHRNPPPSLKYIKPQTREPWAIDAAIYNAKFDTSDYGKPTRYGLNANPPLTYYRLDEEEKRPKGKKGQPAPAWNAKPFKYMPHGLKGIKPAPSSTEPWVEDHRNRNADFENTNVIEDDDINQFDNGGAQKFLNFQQPDWDSSTETAYRVDGRYGRVRGIN
jgi:hypothetical protein